MKTMRLLALSLSILVAVATVSGFAFASMNHFVNTTTNQSMRGGFIDDTGKFSIVPAGFTGPTNGIFITPIALTANASFAHPANMTTDFRATTGAAAGDWVLDFSIANTTNVPKTAVYSVTLIWAYDGNQNGIPGVGQTVYFTGVTNCGGPGCFIFVTFDLGTNFVTPFTYLVTIQRVA